MSIFYSVDVTLSVPHNEITVAKIFQRGAELGFIYYGRNNSLYPTILNSQEATAFLSTTLSGDKDDLPDAYLTVVFEDTNFLIRIDPIENYTRISIFSFGQPWRRQIDFDAYTIDFARYIKLLLTLCKDFSILEAKTTREP